jgi:cytochrome c biogenesis protein CcmG, thiol:disulfide interchange protein DsbE
MIKKMGLYLTPLFIFIVLLIVLSSGINKDPTVLPSQLLDKPLPQFALKNLMTGEMVTDKNWHGKPALINIWATWCPTCLAEHAYLNTLAKQGVVIYGVDYNDDADKARNLLLQYGNPYQQVVFDVDGSLSIDLGVYGAPETFVIDAKGTILYRHIGEVRPDVWQQKLLPVMQAAGYKQ